MLVLLLQVASRDDLAVRLMGLQVLAPNICNQAEETDWTAHRLIGEDYRVALLDRLAEQQLDLQELARE